MKSCQVFRRPGEETLPFVRIKQKLFKCLSQRAGVAIWNGYPAWSDGLGESAAGGPNHHASARNPLKCYNSKRLVIP